MLSIYRTSCFEEWYISFSSHLALHLTAMTFHVLWRVAWQLHQTVPSGLLSCNLLGPIDFSVFRFLRGSQTWASLTLGETLLLQNLPCGSSTWYGKLLSTSASYLFVVTRYFLFPHSHHLKFNPMLVIFSIFRNFGFDFRKLKKNWKKPRSIKKHVPYWSQWSWKPRSFSVPSFYALALSPFHILWLWL